MLRNVAHGFRLLCTTGEDLEKLVDEGKFHDELFYRVASLPLQLPPLRERLEDVPLLVKHFAAQATNPLFDAKLIEFTDDTHANHRSYWQTMSGPSSGPFTVGGAGVYEDTIVKVNGEWLIRKRNIVQ